MLDLTVRNQGVQFGREVSLAKASLPLDRALAGGELRSRRRLVDAEHERASLVQVRVVPAVVDQHGVLVSAMAGHSLGLRVGSARLQLPSDAMRRVRIRARHEKVLRLDVPMDHSLAVHKLQRCEYLECHLDHLELTDASVKAVANSLRKVAVLEELHEHNKKQSII